ncbi:hypothetical protein ACERK3_01705 [Phycisphaerales bacterium AB-hyl4]|uniref:Uncharacterized protein n=1 Tax=Natronomicrosphaera hydrolytica TaxID=3242702 RepID=A0ABV4U2D1_9BACT
MCLTTAIVVAGVASAGGATVLLISKRRVGNDARTGVKEQAEPDTNTESNRSAP